MKKYVIKAIILVLMLLMLFSVVSTVVYQKVRTSNNRLGGFYG